jgi:hypothetical protein
LENSKALRHACLRRRHATRVENPDPELARLVKLTFGGPAIFELKLERQKAKDKIEVLLQKLMENGDSLADDTMPQQLALEFGS